MFLILKSRNYLFFLFLFFFASCSLQKRHYRKGFYVETKSDKGNTGTKNDSTSHAIKLAEDTSAIIPKNKPILLNKTHKHNCDTLLLKDGNTLICNINEVTKRSVRFKNCSDSNEVGNSIDVELVSAIKFYNGKVKTVSIKKENSSLIKAPLVNTGLIFSILAILLEIVLLLALFNVFTISPVLVISFIVSNILTACIGITLGFKSLREIRKSPEIFKGKKTAIAEITLGLLSLVSWLIILVAITIV